MNELQLGLLGAGAVILIGVVGYNAWRSAKIRRKLPRTPSSMDASSAGDMEQGGDEAVDERPFIAPLHEPLRERSGADAKSGLEEETHARQEPSLGSGSGSLLSSELNEEEPAKAVLPETQQSNESEKQAEAQTEVPAAMQAESAAADTRSAANTPSVTIDTRIDCVVPLYLATPIAVERVTTLARRLRRAGNKPVFIEGQTESGSWQTLQAGERYQQLRIAAQLANRSGPLNEVEFSEFVSGVQIFADALNAAPDFPDMLETVSKARQLDNFAAQCDRQLSINLMSDGAPWSANYVQAVAAQDGLLLSRDGTRFVKLDANQHPIFMLQFGSTNFLRDDLTYKGSQFITLLLDVPVAEEDILPFRLMCDYATSLSQRIGARIVDDQYQPLPEATLHAIENHLLKLYAQLEEAGLPAGSPVARRLFSH